MTSLPPSQLEHLRQWIGREKTADDALTRDLACKFHATLNLPGALPQDGDPAPPLIHFCLAQPAVPTAGLGPDGHPNRGDFLPPIPLPRRMWAGGEVRFAKPLLVGQEVRRTSRVVDVQSKAGRSGSLFFVTVEHLLEVNDELLLRERQDIVFRDAPQSTPMPVHSPGEPAGIGEYQRSLQLSAPLLFRYSALTFNGHRIHYDRPYAMEVEGYAGLVVHGPLQATLLAAFATEIGEGRPDHFAFRSRSPFIDGDPICLRAKWNSGSLELWTAKENGPIAMSAAASWN